MNTGSLFYINNRFKTLGILAKIAALEPPCTVGICYSNENDKRHIEAIIDDIIPLGVEYKFIKVKRGD